VTQDELGWFFRTAGQARAALTEVGWRLSWPQWRRPLPIPLPCLLLLLHLLLLLALSLLLLLHLLLLLLPSSRLLSADGPKALKGYTNPTNPPYITKSNPTSWQYPLPKLWPSRLKTMQASFVLSVIIFETLSQMLLQIRQCVLDTSNICLYSSDVKINIKAQSATWYFWCFRATLGSSSW